MRSGRAEGDIVAPCETANGGDRASRIVGLREHVHRQRANLTDHEFPEIVLKSLKPVPGRGFAVVLEGVEPVAPFAAPPRGRRIHVEEDDPVGLRK
jgi:hypothetical protein